jgi:hypothetical protein
MRSVADDDVPVADGIAGDEAVPDVGIAGDEFLNNRSVGPLKDEESAVNGIGEGAAEKEFAAVVGFAGEGKMGVAVGGALFDVVIADLLVEKSEVRHEILRRRDSRKA